MKDRIKQYIEQKGISAGELAVKLDVQRSNISHILNGRNKPGAVFIERFLLVFPDLNARWLLTGTGDMIERTLETKPKNVVTIPNTLPFETLTAPVEKVQDDVEVKKVEVQDSAVAKNEDENEDELDGMVLLFKDGTFATYKKR